MMNHKGEKLNKKQIKRLASRKQFSCFRLRLRRKPTKKLQTNFYVQKWRTKKKKPAKRYQNAKIQIFKKFPNLTIYVKKSQKTWLKNFCFDKWQKSSLTSLTAFKNFLGTWNNLFSISFTIKMLLEAFMVTFKNRWDSLVSVVVYHWHQMLFFWGMLLQEVSFSFILHFSVGTTVGKNQRRSLWGLGTEVDLIFVFYDWFPLCNWF